MVVMLCQKYLKKYTIVPDKFRDNFVYPLVITQYIPKILNINGQVKVIYTDVS